MAEATPKSDYQQVKALMKEIGSPSGFDPIPPDQHRWMSDPDQPALQRFWQWLIAHTIHWGHRSAYAIDKSSRRELHIEHAAKDLDMDLANAYRIWRIGERRGIWRNGNPAEGERRLYLTGKVPRYGEAKANPIVCTDNFPASIRKQLKDWTEDAIAGLRQTLDSEDELEDAFQAAVIAAKRAIFTERKNIIYRALGLVPPAPQEHQKAEETAADAEARRHRIDAIRAPLEGYVQTIAEFVQTAPKDAVQTAATLLPSDSKNQRSESRSGPRSARSRGANNPSQEGEKPIDQLPAAHHAPALSEKERKAEHLIYEQILLMQTKESFQHLAFTNERIDRARPADQLFVYRILGLIPSDLIEQFLRRVWVKLEKFDSNALGKAPGRLDPSEPRSLGLIWHWAKEYAGQIAEAARIERADQQRWISRQVERAYQILDDPNEGEFWKGQARKLIEAANAAQAS